MVSRPIHKQFDEVIAMLHSMADPQVIQSQRRFGINPAHPIGVRISSLRQLAKGCRDHDLALELWRTGIHEARIMASMVDDAHMVSLNQMDAWVKDFDSWDICDLVCGNLFAHTAFGLEYAFAWCEREGEFIRRAGFVLVVKIATFDKTLDDDILGQFFPIMIRCANDERLYVQKAINWALRELGKRRPALWQKAVDTAVTIQQIDTPAAHWIASDALRELNLKRGKRG